MPSFFCVVPVPAVEPVPEVPVPVPTVPLPSLPLLPVLPVLAVEPDEPELVDVVDGVLGLCAVGAGLRVVVVVFLGADATDVDLLVFLGAEDLCTTAGACCGASTGAATSC